MTPKGIKAALTATTVLVGISAGTNTALSQDVDGGIRFLFGISTDLRAHDNRDLDPISAGPTVRSDTTLSFGIQSETRRHKLALNFDGTFRVEEAPSTGTTAEFVNPGVDLSYNLQGGDAQFSFDASYDRSEVDGLSFLDPDNPDPADLINDDGYRNVLRGAVSLELGRTAPLGFVLDLSRSDTRYSGTSDPGLFDSVTDNVTGTAIFRFSQVTEGTLTAGVTQYRAQDPTATTRETYRLSFGISHELSDNTTIEASVGGRQIDDSVTGITSSGEAAFAITHALPRGSVGASLDTELTIAGQKTTAELQRSFVFPTGALDVSLGVVDAEGADLQWIGSLNYSRELARGEVTASLARRISVNTDADVQRTTTAALGLSQMLNEQSSLGFNLDYSDISGVGGGAITDRQTGSFSASYTRALTEDWDLTAGYERRYSNEAGTGVAWDNAVFVTLGRDFSFLR